MSSRSSQTAKRQPTGRGRVERELVAVPAPPRAAIGVQVPTFLLVGGITFVVDTGTLQVSFNMGLSLPVATTIGYLLGLLCHFSLNRMFTFKAHDVAMHRQLGPYLANAGICFLITQAIVNGGHRLWPVPPAFWKSVAVAVTMSLTFVTLRTVVFRRRRHE